MFVLTTTLYSWYFTVRSVCLILQDHNTSDIMACLSTSSRASELSIRAR